MPYKGRYYGETLLKKTPLVEGEPIEIKVQRLMKNKEPITDSSPLIYTDRKDGVLAGYNIRTDRWEVAAEAMDKIQRSNQAKRDAKMGTKPEENKSGEEGKPNDGVAEPTNDTK